MLIIVTVKDQGRIAILRSDGSATLKAPGMTGTWPDLKEARAAAGEDDILDELIRVAQKHLAATPKPAKKTTRKSAVK